ncbi:ribonuclease P subunit p20 family protein [Yamadazyma tenuis]|uniref:Uncharacterized protein n=1 Tax=Candida tenuis (strain ATCC 10573 / BCRC 21748 / CBS 615 / JCM 9827 / NBRC 10315 / NRRL Y-1498 / VKM Y-70) TaxID=590646 RepID=G3AZU4_CANTC|nr:uncharacterized protein CANTEDRAFT_112980 [Yamadazyma tenuis ATCC 10573]XP_006685158.1 uncharacterized protein CANTEDRAFT_112980 [Yamadazyma tenuis ATCC 10573]EGV65471.1 hypothetical protein CANTEDRAFT_112980 [Yamadazyma tenuis ATCC 10573]EGV65472.1 hypothetical protein CANTEDRAFT_112980 [Yamadazyma tenuis ATCC 10573]WEJ95106.1 ribonuclease P subunit p20 family protein [Yamadazyma tenuis]
MAGSDKIKRINGKHIKHRANIHISSVVERETTFLVKSSTPFVSALKRIHKMLDKFNKTITTNTRKYQGGDYKNVKFITVKGMGKTIETTLGIANKLQNEANYRVDVLTGSVEVLDEFAPPDSSDGPPKGAIQETVFQKRMVSYVELHVWLKRE